MSGVTGSLSRQPTVYYILFVENGCNLTERSKKLDFSANCPDFCQKCEKYADRTDAIIAADL